MNEFLHQLRQSKDKHFDRNRRPHQNPQYRDQDRRGPKDYRKPSYNRNTQDTASALEPTLSSIQSVLKEIQDSLKNLAAIEKRRVETEERKTDVLEKIAERLLGFTEAVVSTQAEKTGDQPVQLEQDPAPVETAPADEEPADAHFTREDILEKITGFRREGMSFERISRELEAAGIPTLSGKGRWRGQTVHKLLKQMEA